MVLRNIKDGNSRTFIWRFNYERRRKIVAAVADVQVGEWLSSSMELKDPWNFGLIGIRWDHVQYEGNTRANGGIFNDEGQMDVEGNTKVTSKLLILVHIEALSEAIHRCVVSL